jgi:hypothetical protein
MKPLMLSCTMSFLLLALIACSAGPRSTSSSLIPPVLAQTTYSNASLSGTYSVSFVSPFTTSGLPFYSGIGTVQVNGAGGITGGTLNVYFSGSTTPCVDSVTGTYSIQNTALGTATFNLTSSTKGCATSDTWQLALAAADSGASVQFVRADGSVLSGSATKQ